jgi:hypothetical protein
MNKLGQIAIVIFILNNTLFDLINIPQSTHLSISFFAIMYFSFLLLCVNEWLRNKGMFNIIIGFGFTVKIFLELSKWHMPYKEYMLSVNNYEKNLLFAFLLIALLLTYIDYERRTNNNRNSIK